ncbi:hypothetical protein F5B22DRAFT_435645 [Xylaria bambusicola]|uniref:uncharacterized protein n=1 Tax=Xylaria bambusicola TaxID=326684 RepID=UPI002007AB6B|nr:uncharacterized protein F5B22DRAFT_435645 [Xylaria bambusicola]KAI0506739.1 hypothetical protein F5B22DRAFT_435645 [Xylaria bambusicola]
MSLSKQRISSPLEAGRSIMDAHNLPPELTSTMEYASKRLARKNLHITLIVVKNEYQLPTLRPCATPTSPPQTPEYSALGLASPSRFTSPVVGLRQLVRRGTGSSIASSSSGSSTSSSSSSSETASSVLMSPTFSPLSAEPIASPRRWILPLTPGSPLPSTPLTPHTPSSIATITSAASSCATSHPFQNPESFGVRLIYTSPISPRDEKMIRATITRAERKFHIGVGRIPPVMSASACGLSADLIRQSIQQNEVLFSSEGLTLLGLDRLYSFKAALAAYAKSIITPSSRMQSPLSSPGLSNHPIMPPPTSTHTTADSSRLEDAVDCLRRLVLANGSRPVPKADIYRSFDWMGVNATALADVESMYRRAYGGPERRGPFELPLIPKGQEPTPEKDDDAKRMGFIKIGTPPPPKAQTTPVLKLNTNITTTPRLIKPKPKAVPQASGSTESNRAQQASSSAKGGSGNNAETLEIRFDYSEIATEKRDDCADEDGDKTPHPLRDGPVRPSMFWPNGNALGQSIDEMLSPCDYRQSQRLGPLTPNGYDDISPITRGEWGFLFKGDTWTPGRTAVVETC